MVLYKNQWHSLHTVLFLEVCVLEVSIFWGSKFIIREFWINRLKKKVYIVISDNSYSVWL